MKALALLTALALPAAAAAEPVRDCPQASEPLSSRSPLSDVMMHPGGPAALDSAIGEAIAAVTERFGGGDLPPGFANILTPEALLAMVGGGPDDILRVDEALDLLPITEEFLLERCARYDNDRPELPAPDGRPSVLVFEKITGFRDSPSVDGARASLLQMADERGWQMTFTESGGVMNAGDLARFDVVVWNNVSGDALTLPQRAAFRDYVESGGGFVGMHGSGGDPRYFWDWYADTLVGARFIGHPMDPQFQTAAVSIVDQRSDIGEGVATEFPLLEEWYSFDRNPADDGAVIVATIDEDDYHPGAGMGGTSLAMGAVHPVAWRKFVGDGRAFYTAIGHRPENYSQPDAARLLANGIAWAMGD